MTTITTKRRSRSVAASAILIALIALAGCSAASPDEPPASSTSASDPDEEFAEALTACLQEGGWNAEVDTDGGVIVPGGIPDDQFDQYQTAVAECQAPLTENIPSLSEFTDAQWDELFEAESATAECLRDEGIDIPAIPSQQTFVEQYQSPEPWTSYGFVGDVDQATWETLNAECPQPSM